MNKILKFGTPGRECPCNSCGRGLAALQGGKFTREEIAGAYDMMAKQNLHRDATTSALRKLATSRLKSKKHEKEIEEALGLQARIEQLNHGGWPIEIQAWATVCPDCDRVTQYRAMPTSNFVFTRHGPVAESGSCEDCIKVKVQEANQAEMERRSKLSNEELEAENAAKERAQTIITRELIDEELAKAEAAGGPTPADSARIMRLMNRIGQTIGQKQ